MAAVINHGHVHFQFQGHCLALGSRDHDPGTGQREANLIAQNQIACRLPRGRRLFARPGKGRDGVVPGQLACKLGARQRFTNQGDAALQAFVELVLMKTRNERRSNRLALPLERLSQIAARHQHLNGPVVLADQREYPVDARLDGHATGFIFDRPPVERLHRRDDRRDFGLAFDFAKLFPRGCDSAGSEQTGRVVNIRGPGLLDRSGCCVPWLLGGGSCGQAQPKSTAESARKGPARPCRRGSSVMAWIMTFLSIKLRSRHLVRAECIDPGAFSACAARASSRLTQGRCRRGPSYYGRRRGTR